MPCLCPGWLSFLGGSRAGARLLGLRSCQNSPPFYAHPRAIKSSVPLLLLQPRPGPLPPEASLGPHRRRCLQALQGAPLGGRGKDRPSATGLRCPWFLSRRHKHTPFSSSGSCNRPMPTGPTAWPWPSRTFCGGLEATREPWSHCKCFLGPFCYHLTLGWLSCGQAGCVSSQTPACVPCWDRPREPSDVLGSPALAGGWGGRKGVSLISGQARSACLPAPHAWELWEVVPA